MSLADRAHECEWKDESGELTEALIKDCIRLKSAESLSCLVTLVNADFDFGSHTNRRGNDFALFGLLAWGTVGLSKIRDLFSDSPGSRILRLLAAVAADEVRTFIDPCDGAVEAKVLSSMPDLRSECQSLLLDLFVSIASETRAAALLSESLVRASVGMARLLMRSASGWRQAISRHDLDSLAELILNKADDEPAFQRFFSEHPHLLDPMLQEAWERPDLMGRQTPDYLVRRTDGSYLIVEIETPSKPLITRGGQLSAEATHAIRQVNGYREFVLQNFLVLSRKLPDFREPDCLVVIGLERPLSEEQKSELSRENRSRYGIRIVGFDWLIERASAIRRSLIEGKPARRLRI